MNKTVKFTISLSAGEFKEIEARRRKAGKTRSQFVREAVRARESGEGERTAAAPSAPDAVKEDAVRYGSPSPTIPELTDMAERRRRAIEAAGRFRSGVTDLSVAHDQYLEEGFATADESGPASGSDPGEKP